MTDCTECKKGYEFSRSKGNTGMCYKDMNYTGEEVGLLSSIDWNFWIKVAAVVVLVIGLLILILICYARRKFSTTEVQPTSEFKHIEFP